MGYGRSVFPESYDSFPNDLRDLPPSRIQDAQRLQFLKSKETLTSSEAAELNQLNVELQDYIISPELINTLSDSIKGTQIFFNENVQGFVTTKQNEMNAYTDSKKTEFQAEIDKFTHKGEYNPTVQYYKKNTVTYQGETYLCLQDCINQTPVSLNNTAYWAKIASRGAQGIQGESGIGLTFRGVWSPSVTYVADDAVQYNGQVFACTLANQGIEPNPLQNTTHWTLAIAKGSSTILTTLEKTITITSPTTNVPIGIAEFNASTDKLMVIKNTATLVKGLNYQLNPNNISIDSLEGIWNASAEIPMNFHFIVYKNVVVNLTFSDGTMIQDGTVDKNKLSPSLQTEIENKADQNEVNLLSEDVRALEIDVTTVSNDLTIHINDDMLHVTLEQKNQWSELESEFHAFKSALTEGFTENQFSDGLTSLDAFDVASGYYNQSLSRLEVA